MSMTTFSAQADEDSGLVEQFEEYRQQKGMTKSEAVRSLMRQSLERELDDDQDDVQRDESAQTPSNTASTSSDWIHGNEPIIVGVAWIIGSNGILDSLTTVAGAATGAWIFVVASVLIAAWLLIDAFRRYRRHAVGDGGQTAEQTSAAGGAD